MVLQGGQEGGAGWLCQSCNKLLPLHTALNSWQEPDAAGLPRWPRRRDEAVLPRAQPLDGRRGRSPGGPSPGGCARLSLFGEAQADVVDLNRFLIRTRPCRGCVSSAGNWGCIIRTPPFSRNLAKDWAITEWAGGGGLQAGCCGGPPGEGPLTQPRSGYLSLEGLNGGNRGPAFWGTRSTAEAGRSLGSYFVLVGIPFLSRVPRPQFSHLWGLV